MVYARVHDKTVADDYFRAMAAIEGRMNGDSDALTTPEAARDELERFWERMNRLKEEPPDSRLAEVDRLRDEMLEILQRWAL